MVKNFQNFLLYIWQNTKKIIYNISVKFEIADGTIYLDSVSIDNLLNSQTKQEEVPEIENKTNRVSNILWTVRSLYSNIKSFILSKVRSIKQFFFTLTSCQYPFSMLSTRSKYFKKLIHIVKVIGNVYTFKLNVRRKQNHS